MPRIDPLIARLVAGSFVGGAAAYLGSLMISRRMALVGDALGHVALPGMGLAFLMKVDPGLGAFAFLALSVFLIWKIEHLTSLSMETIVGIVFVSCLAGGFLIVPEPELLESLIGDVSKLTAIGTLVAVLLSVATSLLVRSIYPGMMLLNISPELAAVEGVSEKKYNLVYLAAIALIVSIGVRLMGSLLVGALVIIPPATARILSKDLRQYARISVGAGVAGSVIGILLADLRQFSTGPSIILVSSLIFLLSLGLKKSRVIA